MNLSIDRLFVVNGSRLMARGSGLGDFGVHALICFDLGRISGPYFEDSSCALGCKRYLFCMLVSRLLFLTSLESASGGLGFQKHAFSVRSILKTNLLQKLNLS